MYRPLVALCPYNLASLQTDLLLDQHNKVDKLPCSSKNKEVENYLNLKRSVFPKATQITDISPQTLM